MRRFCKAFCLLLPPYSASTWYMVPGPHYSTYSILGIDRPFGSQDLDLSEAKEAISWAEQEADSEQTSDGGVLLEGDSSALRAEAEFLKSASRDLGKVGQTNEALKLPKEAAKGGRGSSSKFTGVSWNRHDNKWESRICIDGKKNYLGLFDDE